MGTLRIPLGKRKPSGLFAIIDEEDADRVLRHNWGVTIQRGNTRYAVASIGPRGNHKTMRLHRLILDAPPGVSVDHINGDGLDCRRCNLRLASHSQNHMNRRKANSNLSGFKGVNKAQKGNRWLAFITIQGQSKYLGCYKSPEDAARAYDNAAREFHGAFACVNFPREKERSAR